MQYVSGKSSGCVCLLAHRYLAVAVAVTAATTTQTRAR